ncbi:MAG TPA: hypothetical protein VEI02_06005 [Planctomycetota bacterium]|nr:hypothetical protein [Planctomycetota bacterium]
MSDGRRRALLLLWPACQAGAAAFAAHPPAVFDDVGYVVLPVLCLAWLAPGVLAAARFRPAGTLPETALLGAGLAAAFHMAAGVFAKALVPGPVPAWFHHALLAAVGIAFYAALWKRPASARAPDRHDRADVFGAAMVFLLALGLSADALHGDLSSDGVEAFEMGRSLEEHPFPRKPGGGGTVAADAGMIVQAYVTYWFHLAFPHLDQAPRLPFVLFLPIVLLGVVAAAEVGGTRRVTASGARAAGVAVVAYGLAVGFNVTNDPYFADLASPGGALSVQTATFQLGIVYAALRRSLPELLLFAVLGRFAAPSSLPLLAALAVFGALLFERGTRLRHLGRCAVALGAAFLAGKIYEQAAAATFDAPAEADSLASRLRYLEFGDVGRLVWLIVPSGFVPFGALFAFRTQDREARVVTAATLATFGVLYVQAAYNPHHFTPAMTLPAVVLHRVLARIDETAARRWRTAALAGGLLAAGLAVPRAVAQRRPYSELGRTVLFEGPDVRRDLDGALAAADMLGVLMAPCDADVDPSRRFTGSTLSVARYARRVGPVGADVDFVVRPFEAPVPPGFLRVDAANGFAFYARSLDAVDAVRRLDRDDSRLGALRTDWPAPLFRVDRDRLFRRRAIAEGKYDVDLKAFLSR